MVTKALLKLKLDVDNESLAKTQKRVESHLKAINKQTRKAAMVTRNAIKTTGIIALLDEAISRVFFQFDKINNSIQESINGVITLTSESKKLGISIGKLKQLQTLGMFYDVGAGEINTSLEAFRQSRKKENNSLTKTSFSRFTGKSLEEDYIDFLTLLQNIDDPDKRRVLTDKYLDGATGIENLVLSDDNLKESFAKAQDIAPEEKNNKAYENRRAAAIKDNIYKAINAQKRFDNTSPLFETDAIIKKRNDVELAKINQEKILLAKENVNNVIKQEIDKIKLGSTVDKFIADIVNPIIKVIGDLPGKIIDELQKKLGVTVDLFIKSFSWVKEFFGLKG